MWGRAAGRAGQVCVQVVSRDRGERLAGSVSDGSLGTDLTGETGPVVGHLPRPPRHHPLAGLPSHPLLDDPPHTARQDRAGLGLLGHLEQVRPGGLPPAQVGVLVHHQHPVNSHQVNQMGLLVCTCSCLNRER